MARIIFIIVKKPNAFVIFCIFFKIDCKKREKSPTLVKRIHSHKVVYDLVQNGTIINKTSLFGLRDRGGRLEKSIVKLIENMLILNKFYYPLPYFLSLPLYPNRLTLSLSFTLSLFPAKKWQTCVLVMCISHDLT